LSNSDPIVIGGRRIGPGERATIELPIPHLHTHTPMSMVVHILRGRKDGPRLFVSAAIHGDELNGIEIVRRLLRQKSLRRLRGTLIAVPIVNAYGVIHHSRYLPDRRDLNRAFPGSERGSLAARLANLLMQEIVSNTTHGIDLHTGAVHRFNLPQIRANLDDKETRRLARAFGVPVLVHAESRDGSLRAEVNARDMPMLLYEAGEALRMDEFGIRVGVRGILNVLRALQMLPEAARPRDLPEPFITRSSTWVRAQRSGMLLRLVSPGMHVSKGGTLGVIADPYGEGEETVVAPAAGVVIGCTHLPLVNEGDAVAHLARFKDPEGVAEKLDSFQSEPLHPYDWEDTGDA